MKKLILFALTAFMMMGCEESKRGEQKIYVIDSCEYYGVLDYALGNYLAHKGNCKYCAERRKKELKKLVEQIKEEYDKQRTE